METFPAVITIIALVVVAFCLGYAVATYKCIRILRTIMKEEKDERV